MTSLSTPARPLRTDRSTQILGPGDGSVLGVHVLQAGETLRAVAQRYGVSGEDLLAVNPGLDPRQGMAAGRQINIPAPRPRAPLSARAFDFDAPLPAQTPGALLNPLAPPTTQGVRLRQTTTRSYFSDPHTGALPPQPMTWPQPERALKMGSRNPEVEIVQRALCRIGYTLRVDGDFGGGTDLAVRHFQGLAGITPTGSMTPETWTALRATLERIQQPQQVLVQANRNGFSTEEERNAYDILLAMAYDEPGSANPSDGGMRDLLRVLAVPVSTPPVITNDVVTAFANRARQAGLPLDNASLAPLEPMRLDTTSDRLNYNQARSVSELLTRKMRGSRVDSTTYDALIVRYARQYGLEPEVVKAIMAIESNFNPNAGSSAGAQGLMQVMPDTAAFVGVNDLSTPEANIDAGVRYLADLARRFNGDLVYMAAGYNSGPNRVARNGGVPPIQETYDYVRRFLSHYAYYRLHPVR